MGGWVDGLFMAKFKINTLLFSMIAATAYI